MVRSVAGFHCGLVGPASCKLVRLERVAGFVGVKRPTLLPRLAFSGPLLFVRIDWPRRIGCRKGACSRWDRQISAWRHHQWRPLLVFDTSLLAVTKSEAAEQSVDELRIRQFIIVIVACKDDGAACDHQDDAKSRTQSGTRESTASIFLRHANSHHACPTMRTSLLPSPHAARVGGGGVTPIVHRAEVVNGHCHVESRPSNHRVRPIIRPLRAFIMSYQGTFAESCKNKDSQTSPITPATIAASARLKTYHWNVQVAAVM